MTFAATRIYLGKTISKTTLPWGIDYDKFNIQFCSLRCFSQQFTCDKKLTFDLKQLIKSKWEDLPTPQLLREAKDHPQQHINHLQDIISFLDDDISAYQASCCSQRSTVIWFSPSFPPYYFSRQKNKTFR